MIAFLDVVLRGAGLASQAIAVGGVLFALLVLRPGSRAQPEFGPLLTRGLTLVAVGGIGAAVAQGLILVLLLGALASADGWPLGALAASPYFHVSVIRILAGAGLAATSVRARLTRGSTAGWAAMAALALILVATSALTSHAAARLDHRAWLMGLDALHQLAASVWIGGLVHLTAATLGSRERAWPAGALRRFSLTAVAAVTTLVAAGVALAVDYIGGLDALIGTSYGMMIATKTVLLATLLLLGALNFLTVRRLGDTAVPSTRLWRFVEVEIGVGLTALFAAASLTSLPPAVDVAERATVSEVRARFEPTWPRLTSPAITELPVADREAPRTAEDRAWSEYNHHWSGILVLTMGLLASVQGMRWARWARHWPLVFLALAGFMLARNDPGAWPLGPMGFWESMTYPSVLQHRLAILLVIGFGVFEWMVRTGRLRARGCALVFPLVCAVGSAILITHSHALDNLKAEFLIEVTHTPLAIVGLLVGWSRWLELRLPAPENHLPGRLWPAGLALVGLLLVFYREP